jgi:hypothetical protein
VPLAATFGLPEAALPVPQVHRDAGLIQPVAGADRYRSGVLLGADTGLRRSRLYLSAGSHEPLPEPARRQLEMALRAYLRRSVPLGQAALVSAQVSDAAVRALRNGQPVAVAPDPALAHLPRWEPPPGTRAQDFCFGSGLRVAGRQLLYDDPVRGPSVVAMEEAVHTRLRAGGNGFVLQLGADKAVKVLFRGAVYGRLKDALWGSGARRQAWRLAHDEHDALGELAAAGVQGASVRGVATFYGHPALVYDEYFAAGSKDMVRRYNGALMVRGPGAHLLGALTLASLDARERELVRAQCFPHDAQLLFRANGEAVIADPLWLEEGGPDPAAVQQRFQASFGRFAVAAHANRVDR